MSCPHLSAAFNRLKPPRPSQRVHREECTLCFDDQDSPSGIDVCLDCFNGGCSSNHDRAHSRLHFSKTGHPLVVNVRRVLKKVEKLDDDLPSPPKKLAIAAEKEEDKYDFVTTPKCLACDEAGQGKVLPRTEKLEEVISGVMKALSSAQQSEVKAWEEEIVPCSHTIELKQVGEARKLEPSGLASCNKCDLTSNLWLCLTCGNLGCGRAQFGGVGGNSHGLSHFEETGHPCSVKQGTITAEGTADVYCYACNDARIDPSLSKHLSHFGINVMDLSKTEKSMTELQLEQNLKFDFNMTGEDGKQLEPVFGPGFTGLRNLGNSCYLASVLQAIFSLPTFQTRYLDAYKPHTLACTKDPADCFECQMCKIADGLLSGRYAVPRTEGGRAMPQSSLDEESSETKKEGPIFQAGIRPSMFKSLVGKGHDEFSTMRQQDADEFFKHLVSHIQRESKSLTSSRNATTSGCPTEDPTGIFSFALEHRLQCDECKKVRYTVENQDAGISLPVPLREKIVEASDEEGKAAAEGPSAPGPKVEYEPVSLTECLDIFTSPEQLDYRCPSCQRDVKATKQTHFKTFPQVLAVQVRRFQLVNWVPQKVEVPIVVPLGEFELDRYVGRGKQQDEVELPADKDDSINQREGGGGTPSFDEGVMSQLTSMGFPEVRCQRALLETGNGKDAEVAMNWLFAHMEDEDIDDPIDFDKYLPKSGGAGEGGRGQQGLGGDNGGVDTSMLEEMGFSRGKALKALRLNGQNSEMAIAWLFDNPDDEGDDENGGGEEVVQETVVGQSEGQEAGGAKAFGGSDLLPARYEIRSFISHKGPSVHSGHYVCHVRKSVDVEDAKKGEQGWTFFNDEKVVKAPFSSSSEVDGQTGEPQRDVGVKGLSMYAYEYFFERV
ncbi:ubiquitinyl hydrolase [Violaceomyces palustris]|uniref:Ubiquitinyl hydrolase n=1 Tax=Violaceomyces palustris TaxID=1673888 RepID=A0ACD0NST4_9BASI|nr:ubiquitinyl hydrolase [Violaceomyces palustris]